MKCTYRKAASADVDQIFGLIKELAVYEKAGHELEISIEELRLDGFGPSAIYECFVAEIDHKIVGFALFYTKYSTWKGRCLYLEDFLVSEAYRNQGIGKILFEMVIKEAQLRKVRRLEWQVLEWNKTAINFYKKFGAILDPEWINGKFVYNQLQDFSL